MGLHFLVFTISCYSPVVWGPAPCVLVRHPPWIPPPDWPLGIQHSHMQPVVSPPRKHQMLQFSKEPIQTTHPDCFKELEHNATPLVYRVTVLSHFVQIINRQSKRLDRHAIAREAYFLSPESGIFCIISYDQQKPKAPHSWGLCTLNTLRLQQNSHHHLQTACISLLSENLVCFDKNFIL